MLGFKHFQCSKTADVALVFLEQDIIEKWLLEGIGDISTNNMTDMVAGVEL